MIVYGAPLSPYVRKVTAVCVEKDVDYTLVPVGLGDPNPDFAAASPFKKMPAIKDGDFTLSDSSAIVAYIDAKHPDQPMIPADAQARGKAIWFDEFADTMLVAAIGKVFFNRIVAPRFLGRPGDEAVAELAEKTELPPLLAYLETVAPSDGFLLGDSISLADISVGCPFVNWAHCGGAIDPTTHPKAAAYVARIHARPSFAGSIVFERQILGLS
jgi:glutathione S-transferase